MRRPNICARECPAGANVLIEPSHNTPPIGSYFTAPSFYKDYVLWGGGRRDDYYHLVGLDPYVFLYRPAARQREAAAHLDRLAAVDWIVIDETYIEFYEHLPEAQHGLVKQYYQDLLAGQAGVQPAADVPGPSLALWLDFVDDRAELTFRLFDHPRIYIFRRATPSRQP